MNNKIIIIGHHLVLKSYQELIQDLSKSLTPKNIDISLITPKVYKEKIVITAETIANGCCKHIKLKTVLGRAGRQHAHFYLGLMHTLKLEKPNLIYCMEEPNSIVSVQVAYCASKLNVPVIFWSALNQNRDYSKLAIYDIRRFLYPFCINYTFNNSIAINALDNTVSSVLKARGYKNEIFVQNTFGVNDVFFESKEIKNSRPLKVIYVGVLEEHKGVEFLIKSVRSSLKQITLAIVGDGSQKVDLEHISSGNVKFYGHVNYSQVQKLMKSADVLVLPSVPCNGYVEQFGRVLIEAMASNLCVIGTNVGGIGNVIDDSGFLIEHSNVQQLEKILKNLSEDNVLLNRMKSRAYQRAQKEYSYKSVGSKLAHKLVEYIHG